MMFMNIIYIIFIAILIVSFITGVLVTKFDKSLSQRVERVKEVIENTICGQLNNTMLKVPDLPVVEESRTQALKISGEYSIQNTSNDDEYYEIPILIPIQDDQSL